MDIADEIRRREEERDARPLPARASRIDELMGLLPTHEHLGPGWSVLSTHVPDARHMARCNSVYVSRRYDCTSLPSLPADTASEGPCTLIINIRLFEDEEGPLAAIGHLANDFDESRSLGNWRHGFYGVLWESCIAYPRSDNFNDMMVVFPVGSLLYTLQAHSYHAFRLAKIMQCRDLGQDYVPTPYDAD